jgi:DNA-binding GntR family transcriptional regulator
MEASAPASLTEAVYRSIRADLLACRIPPGERLRIAALCARHDASLGAVREALSRLSAEGLVVAEPQRGFQAATISAEDLKDLTLARVEIERLCLKASLERGDLAWEERLIGVCHRLMRTPMRVDDDPERVSDAWADAHHAFHDALVAACGNATLLRLRRQLYSQSERYRRLSVPLAEIERDLDAEHRDIAAAALDRDSPRALHLIKAHIELTTDILLRSFDGHFGLVA